MFHNYQIIAANTTCTVSVDVGTAVNSAVVSDDSRYTHYYGTNTVYINGKLHIEEAQQFKIATHLIIMQWTSENL